MVQLREKDLAPARLLPLARRLRDITAGKAMLFVNDHLDVALAAGADGVQLPEDGLPVADAVNIAEERLLVGRSVHTVRGGVEASSQGANLLLVGTVFASRSHPERAPQGLAVLQELRATVKVPMLAIGGVTPENVGAAMEKGASGAAAITAITEAEDPQRASRSLVQAVERAWPPLRQASAVSSE
jgi:thiamine-phosphate pyrophosphorylase